VIPRQTVVFSPNTYKHCTKCKELKPVSCFSYTGKIHSWCKECFYEDRRQRELRNLKPYICRYCGRTFLHHTPKIYCCPSHALRHYEEKKAQKELPDVIPPSPPSQDRSLGNLDATVHDGSQELPPLPPAAETEDS
jgi:hypothetical protein